MHNFVYLAQRRSQEFSFEPNFGGRPLAAPVQLILVRINTGVILCYTIVIIDMHNLLCLPIVYAGKQSNKDQDVTVSASVFYRATLC